MRIGCTRGVLDQKLKDGLSFQIIQFISRMKNLS
jgi:hypothetical protein